MILQLGNDGVVSKVDEEELVYVDKNELEQFIDNYHQLEEENKQLKSENQGIQDKVMRLLDYVELKQCVTRTEIKKWWNGDVE